MKNWCANGTPNGLDWETPFWVNGSQWPLGMNNGDPATYASVHTNYDYAFGDTTQLYNRPEIWIPADAALDILHASRSILWLKPDHIVVYDRATSHTAGLFKQFNLSFPNLPTLNGNFITTTTPGGQKLYVTSLLPAGATFTSIPIAGTLTTVADLEPCQYRLVIQDPSNPTDERFLHVFQGADAGVQPDGTALIHSSAGTPMDGVVVGDTVVLFIVDATTPFNGTTYTVPANVNQHFITGCVPNGFYRITGANRANGLVVTVAPSASGSQADSAGVLVAGALTATAPALNVVASPPNMTLSWPTNAAGLCVERILQPGLTDHMDARDQRHHRQPVQIHDYDQHAKRASVLRFDCAVNLQNPTRVSSTLQG